MAITEQSSTKVWNDEFLDSLEDIRRDLTHGELLRPPKRYASKEEAADAKRKSHLGGAGNNHKFVGEKYLNATDKEIRRELLRKLIDEGGQQTVGTGLPSHPTLSKWNSKALGITDAEIHDLEKQDPRSDYLIFQCWKTVMHRETNWAIANGSSLVGEGEKVVPEAQEQLQAEIEQMRKDYIGWGIKDLGPALANAIEHAGVDVDHAHLAARPVQKYITTPELQDEMRRIFTLMLHQRAF